MIPRELWISNNQMLGESLNYCFSEIDILIQIIKQTWWWVNMKLKIYLSKLYSKFRESLKKVIFSCYALWKILDAFEGSIYRERAFVLAVLWFLIMPEIWSHKEVAEGINGCSARTNITWRLFTLFRFFHKGPNFGIVL